MSQLCLRLDRHSSPHRSVFTARRESINRLLLGLPTAKSIFPLKLFVIAQRRLNDSTAIDPATAMSSLIYSHLFPRLLFPTSSPIVSSTARDWFISQGRGVEANATRDLREKTCIGLPSVEGPEKENVLNDSLPL